MEYNGRDLIMRKRSLFHVTRYGGLLSLPLVFNSFAFADVTHPYVCQRTPTYGNTSDKLRARFVHANAQRTRTDFCRRKNIGVKIGSCALNFAPI